jgi:hypothetical protein
MAAAFALAAPALAAEPMPVFPAQAAAPATPAPSYAPGQIIVVWEEDASRHEKAAAREGAEVEATTNLGDSDYQLVEVEAGQSMADALAELRTDPAVAIAERNGFLTPTAEPNDPLFSQQWALKNNGPPGINGVTNALVGKDIKATTAWDFFNPLPLPEPGAIVADIDSGYRFAGSDLGPVAWTNPGEIPENGLDDDGDGIIDDVHGADFVGPNADAKPPLPEDGDPTDDNLISGGHGVHTAGIIGAAGNNGFGTAGVGWAGNVRIMPLRVCAASPSATPANALACPTSSIISAIKYASVHGAEVANISLTSTSESKAMAKALAEAKETLFVIAAGNDAKNNDSAGQAHYPCNYQPNKEEKESGVVGAIDNIVCVAATNQRDELASFSDWGTTSVDLGAPGTEILSTYPLELMLNENFGTDAEYNAKWQGTFGRAEGAPLTSSGMSDSPEENPVANTTREVELKTPITVPPGYGNCVFAGKRSLALTGGTFTQEVLRNGEVVLKKEISSNTNPPFSMQSFTAEPTLTNLAESSVNLRFKYAAGPSPASTDGVWLDDLTLTCYQATTVAPGYAFLQGTSMAAPQVSGTAGLMFSLQPAASVKTIREALLGGVEADSFLSGKTVTGGRLNAAQALAKLDITPPLTPVLNTETSPASPNESGSPLIIGSETDATATVRIYSTPNCTGAFVSGSAAQLANPGIHVTVPHEATVEFSANAIDPAKNVSGCSTPAVKYQQKDDKEPPLAPQLTATNPSSPGASATPQILGVAEPKSMVRLYSNEACVGTPVAAATAEALTSPGIPVSVPSATTVTFWATATDAAQNVSPCSSPISYTNSSLIEPIVKPPTQDPPASTSCTVPKVAGKTLAQAKAALSRSICKTGKVTKPKVQPGKKLGALVVKSSSPAAGAVAASGVVTLKLGPKPKARRR